MGARAVLAGAWPRIRRSALGRILTGSALGQGLVFLTYPLVAALYSPADFGLFVVFTSVVSMVAVAATGSFDAAVLIPETDAEATAVAWAGIGTVVATSVLTALVGALAGDVLAPLLGSPGLARFWWLIALTVLAIGLFLMLTGWLVRRQQYSALARRNAYQGIGQVVVQLGLGVLAVRPAGLLLGLGAGRLAGIGGAFGPGGLLRSPFPGPARIRAAVRRYRWFPLVASWSKLLNTAGLQLPILVISAAYGDVGAGLLGLAMRVVGGPVGVLAQAAYHVYSAEASARVRGRADLAALTRGWIVRLALAGAGPAALLVVAAPPLFGLVFGPEWVDAGQFARFLALSYLAEFAVMPISQTLLILERQGLQLAWNVARLVLTVGAPAACARAGLGIGTAVAALAAAHLVAYGVLVALSLRAARAADRAHEGGPS